jgi:hypothetical protein
MFQTFLVAQRDWQVKAEQILSSLLQLKHVLLEFDKGTFAIVDLKNI